MYTELLTCFSVFSNKQISYIPLNIIQVALLYSYIYI